MKRVDASMFRGIALQGALPAALPGMLLVVLLALPAVVFADAGHDAKPAAEMPSMDHSKPGAMDHSKMGGADMGGHWMAPPEAAARKNPIRADKASIARGKKIYAANCASCHGVRGKGDGPAGNALNPKPADLAAMAPKHPAGDLAWKIEHGRGAMPAWKGTLKQKQIWDVVNFLQALTPAADDGKSGSKEIDGGHVGHAH